MAQRLWRIENRILEVLRRASLMQDVIEEKY